MTAAFFALLLTQSVSLDEAAPNADLVAVLGSLNIIAAEDNTTVTIEPVAAITGGGGVPGGAANQPLDIMLNAGQQAQITQNGELTGSVIQSDKPIGLMGGHPCMRAPVGTALAAVLVTAPLPAQLIPQPTPSVMGVAFPPPTFLPAPPPGSRRRHGPRGSRPRRTSCAAGS